MSARGIEKNPLFCGVSNIRIWFEKSFFSALIKLSIDLRTNQLNSEIWRPNNAEAHNNFPSLHCVDSVSNGGFLLYGI